MPVPAIDADKRGDAYKKVKPVDGIDEQGLVPDPQVTHVLFARLMAILGPLGILPIIFAVNSVTTAVNFAAASMGAREDFERARAHKGAAASPPPSLPRLTATNCYSNTCRTELRRRKRRRAHP